MKAHTIGRATGPSALRHWQRVTYIFGVAIGFVLISVQTSPGANPLFHEGFEADGGALDGPFFAPQTLLFPQPSPPEQVFILNTEGFKSWGIHDPAAVVKGGINDNVDSQGVGTPVGGFHGSQGLFLLRDVADDSEAGGIEPLTPLTPPELGGPGASGAPTALAGRTIQLDLAFLDPSDAARTELDFVIELGIHEVDGDELVRAWLVTVTRELQTFGFYVHCFVPDEDGGVPQDAGGGVLGDSEVALLYFNFYDPIPQGEYGDIVFFVDDFVVAPEPASLLLLGIGGLAIFCRQRSQCCARAQSADGGPTARSQ